MITELHVKNFCGIHEVDIEPTRSVNTVGGRNGSGKSSLLNAITALVGGPKHFPDMPIRSGSSKAEIVGTIDTESGPIIVERTISEGRSKVAVKAADGSAFKSPQAMLDSLVGALGGFDPLAFTRLDPKKQADQLRKIVGLDFSFFDSERAERYTERTSVGRDLEKAKGALALAKHYPDAPKDEVSVAELADELNAAIAINRSKEDAERFIANAELRAKTHRTHCDDIRNRIAMLEQELTAELEMAVDAENDIRDAREKAAEISPVDVNPIREQMQSAEEINGKVRANKARAAAKSQCDAAKAQYDDLTRQIEEIDDEKRKQMAEAAWPVDGLGFDETSGLVTFRGRPFSQASSAEQIRVSLAMGMSGKQGLKTLFIKDGSLLDADTMAVIQEQVEANGFQVFVEVVSQDDCSIVISEGRVAELEAAHT